MSRYNKLIKEILDGIFEGYALEDGKLKVVNESAAKSADSALHKLVLEKSRDLWDVLEANEESLADVAEEISFMELNADPSSVDTSVPVVDASGEEQQQVQEPTLENLLGSEDFDLDSIFEVLGVHDGKVHRDEPTMHDPEDRVNEGPEGEEDVEDGVEDREDMEWGGDDAGLGSSDEEGEEGVPGDLEMGDEPPMGDEGGEMMDLEPGDEMGDEGATFDFDLELGDDSMGDLEGGEEPPMDDLEGEEPMGDLEGEEPMGDLEGELDLGGEEEEAEEGMGAHKPYRM